MRSDHLAPHVDAFKIASYVLAWDPLLAKVAATGRPIIASTGMATLEECTHAVAVMRQAGAKDITLLHCVSAYPTPPGEANLAAIKTLRDATGCPVGWSDHTVSPGVIHRAVHRWYAPLIEFHLDLDGLGAEYASGHCWLPYEMAAVIREVRTAEAADGNGLKVPMAVGACRPRMARRSERRPAPAAQRATHLLRGLTTLMSVVAIIQARMGSKRLPGKVLKPLAGKPLLWHSIHRLRKCARLDTIVVATSNAPQDAAVADLAQSEGIPFYRGSEEDVLARLAGVAAAFEATVIVRVNADAPLIDPALIDKLVERLIAADADYVMAPPDAPCFHDGVDPMSRRVLDRMMRVAHDDPLAREHVTGFLKVHRDFGRIALLEVEPALALAGPSLAIDTAEDFAFFEEALSPPWRARGRAGLARGGGALRGRRQGAHARRQAMTASRPVTGPKTCGEPA